MKKYRANRVDIDPRPDGCATEIAHDIYLAAEADARIAELEAGNGLSVAQFIEMMKLRSRIAELERLLDVERSATAAAQEQADKAARWEAEANRLGERVAELEGLLREAHTILSAHCL